MPNKSRKVTINSEEDLLAPIESNLERRTARRQQSRKFTQVKNYSIDLLPTDEDCLATLATEEQENVRLEGFKKSKRAAAACFFDQADKENIIFSQ
jgi:hypothetical protein